MSVCYTQGVLPDMIRLAIISFLGMCTPYWPPGSWQHGKPCLPSPGARTLHNVILMNGTVFAIEEVVDTFKTAPLPANPATAVA